MPDESRVIIGQVQGTHGVRGQFKIKPLTDFPERFFDMDELCLYRDGKPAGTYKIRDMRDALMRGHVIASVEGVDNMDQAEFLVGCSVEVSKDNRVELAPGEVWISDLLGLNVFDDHDNRLGILKDVLDSGAARLFVITDDVGKEHMVPASEEFFLNVDLEAKRMTVHLIDGLWDL